MPNYFDSSWSHSLVWKWSWLKPAARSCACHRGGYTKSIKIHKIHQNPSNPVSFHSRLSHMLYKSSMSKGSSAPNMWHPILKHTQLSYCMYLLAICFSKHIPIKWKSYTIMLVTYIFIAELHPLADDFLVVCNGIQPHTLPCRRTSPSHGWAPRRFSLGSAVGPPFSASFMLVVGRWGK